MNENPVSEAGVTATIGTDEQSDLPEQYQWKGEGPAPAKWTAADGTIVYRSYADYCWD